MTWLQEPVIVPGGYWKQSANVRFGMIALVLVLGGAYLLYEQSRKST